VLCTPSFVTFSFFFIIILFISVYNISKDGTYCYETSLMVCQKEIVVQTLPAVMHAVGCSIPQHPNAILRDAFRLTTYPV